MKVHLVCFGHQEPPDPRKPYTVIECFTNQKKAFAYIKARPNNSRKMWVQTWIVE